MNIACLGDSNTRFQLAAGGNYALPGPGARPCWPEYAAELAPGHRWLNFAVGGSSACALPAGLLYSLPQLENARRFGPVDCIIAAFGTNDFQAYHRTRDDVLTAYCALVAIATPTPILIATTPQCGRLDYVPAGYPSLQAQIDDLNHVLLAMQKAGWPVLDFDSGDLVDELDLPDVVHVSAAAQQERARRAVAALDML